MKNQKSFQKEIKFLRYVCSDNDGKLESDVRSRFGSDLVDNCLYCDLVQRSGNDSIQITINGNDKIKQHTERKLTTAVAVATLVITLASFLYQLFVH